MSSLPAGLQFLSPKATRYRTYGLSVVKRGAAIDCYVILYNEIQFISHSNYLLATYYKVKFVDCV